MKILIVDDSEIENYYQCSVLTELLQIPNFLTSYEFVKY